MAFGVFISEGASESFFFFLNTEKLFTDYNKFLELTLVHKLSTGTGGLDSDAIFLGPALLLTHPPGQADVGLTIPAPGPFFAQVSVTDGKMIALLFQV